MFQRGRCIQQMQTDRVRALFRRLSMTAAGAVLLCAGAPERGAVQAQPERQVRAGSLTYLDRRLGEKMPERGWLLYIPRASNADYGARPTYDRKLNQPYPYGLHVDCNTGDTRERRFVVHFQRGSDEPLARKAGGLLARLYWIGRDYLGVGPARDRHVDVWLARSGKAGGEEYLGDIYLYAIDEPRAPAEWIRELAHEYSHVTLPEIGPYSAPEKWGNGYLGERLYLKWLLHDNGPTQIWDGTVDGTAYVERQIKPLRETFLNQGPLAPAATRTDGQGMAHLIGRVLAVEVTYGPSLLRAAFAGVKTIEPRDLDTILARAVQRTKAPLEIDPLAHVPAQSRVDRPESGVPRFTRAAYRVLMPPGDWKIQVRSDSPRQLRASLEAAALNKTAPSEPDAATWDAEISRGIWRRLDIVVPDGTWTEIRGIRIERTGQ
jgi:hypothetical protein